MWLSNWPSFEKNEQNNQMEEIKNITKKKLIK